MATRIYGFPVRSADIKQSSETDAVEGLVDRLRYELNAIRRTCGNLLSRADVQEDILQLEFCLLDLSYAATINRSSDVCRSFQQEAVELLRRIVAAVATDREWASSHLHTSAPAFTSRDTHTLNVAVNGFLAMEQRVTDTMQQAYA